MPGNIAPFPGLACPLDGDPLCREGSAWRCPAGHNFDIAGEGYVNLLPVQKKRSLDPGDSKEMVAARRRFLNAGHYRPIAAAVARRALDDSSFTPPLACLDAGCGEGYYLRQLAADTPDGRHLAVLGLDISKWAVLSAAKQDKRPAWVVGSNANLPILPASVDRILCLFGFPVFTEFARVLRPGGLLLLADSGPDHLRELREIIYPTLKPARTDPGPVPAGFVERPGESVRFALDLSGAGPVADLLAMTPHLHRATAEGRARAAALTEISLTVDVRLRCLERQAAI